MNLDKISKYFYPYRILDIGANIGQFHKLAKTYYPDSFIFSIEASPECEEELKKVTENYYIGLLAKSPLVYKFYVNKNDPTSTGNSIYKELTPFFDDSNLNIVERIGIKLDDLFEEESEFDLIKIDTQGSELDIISGGLGLCSKAKGILLEVSLEQYNENSPLIEEVIEFMSKIGFKATEEIGYGHHPLTGKLIQKDILFIKND